VGSAVAAVALGRRCAALGFAAQDSDSRLTARPRDSAATTLADGPLGIGADGRDGVVHLPPAIRDGKVPLLVFFHGATQNGAGILRRIAPAADEAGVAVLAPDSRGTTWDAVRGSFGQDVAFLNRALEFVFERLNVDPTRLALGGFSDGASYALSLGLANGDVFPRVVACSPGFVVPGATHGRSRFFVTHGRSDTILPIDRCSRVIVPQLRSMGYEVTFREFDGRHELPPDIAGEAFRWMAATSAGTRGQH
jgi:phospholipase/carboxylesterase